MNETDGRKALFDVHNRIEEYLVTLNLSRTILAAIINILFLALNLGMPYIHAIPYAAFSIALGILLATFFIFLITWAKGNSNLCPATKRRIYMGFFVASVISLTPFWLAAGSFFTTTIKALIMVSFTLLALPVFSKREMMRFGPFFALYVSMGALVGEAPWRDVALIFMFALASCAIAFYLHKGYIDIILRLQVESDTDSLTGLCNRRAGHDLMKRTLAICGRAHLFCVVYMIDIDFFKSFNDTYGHLSGDDALKCISYCINQQFSRPADITCRFGGEEFVVMAIMSGEKAAREQADELLARVENMRIPSARKSVSEHLTVSVGCVCFFPQHLDQNDAADLNMILKEADSELYRAKQEGRNRISVKLLGKSEVNA